jgi:folate-binding protein YgfZ
MTKPDSVAQATENLSFFQDPASVVWLGGEAPLDYLQRMSTNKLVDLAVGQGRQTILTSDVGRAIDLLACYRGRAGVALITTSASAAASVAQHLKRYVLFGDKVTVTDASQQVGLIRLAGKNAPAVARAITGIDVPLSEAGAWVETGQGEDSLWMLRHLEPGLGGVDLVLPRGKPLEALIDKLRHLKLREGEEADLSRLRIRAGMPAFGAEIDGLSNPLELGLLDAIDFGKGCYIGQEVIARLANYEKIQRRLVRLSSDLAIEAGTEVFPETQAGERRPRPGRITSAALAAVEISVDAGSRSESTGPEQEGGWQALAIVPLATRAGDKLCLAAASNEDSELIAGDLRVVAEIGRMPEA